MDDKIDAAIEKVLGLIRVNMTPDEAMKTTQAALNLAHAKQLISPKPGKNKPSES